MTEQQQKIEIFAQLVESDQIESLHRRNLACQGNLDGVKTRIKPGKKYTKVDVGHSGKYMIEHDTGDIYGIKAYGVIHRGHRYGNLETINDYYWGEYQGMLICLEAVKQSGNVLPYVKDQTTEICLEAVKKL